MKFDGFQVSCFETMHRMAPDKSSGLTASVQSEDGKGAHVGLCVGFIAAVPYTALLNLNWSMRQGPCLSKHWEVALQQQPNFLVMGIA